MKLKRFILLVCSMALVAVQAMSQSIANGYTVGTWSGFRTSAATFTFDDGCANQANVIQYFDKYGYKASFYPPTSWVSNWSTFQSRVNKGYEVGSHSVNHGNTMPDSEIKESKDIINQNITGQDCNTITYPNCNEPSESELAKYYIGGRICNGQVEGPTPQNYFQIGSLICGSEGSYKTVNDFLGAFQQAINKKGWVVFLVHEIDNGSGYSPLSSSVLSEVLDSVNKNDDKIWLTTFRNAILYSKERNALSLAETTESSKLKLPASVNITSSVVEYNYPITVRRQMPNGWTNFAAATNNTDIEVKIITVGSTKYAQFDVIPGKTYYLEDRESEYTSNGGEEEEVTFEEMISNGEFDSGTSGWQTQTGGNAQLTMTATTSAGLSGTNAVSLCPNGNSGSENWHIQMFQNVTLEPNVDYTLKFMAKGATSRKLYVMVQKIAADYDTYFYKEYDLTTSAQEYEESITTPADVAADSKVTFCIGGADGCVYLDKVSFGYEKSNGGGGGGGDNPHYDVDITGDISKYFIDKGYVGPSCDALAGEEVTDGAYFTGVYPNLFVKYLGKTQEQVDQKMQELWQHFFTVGGQNTVYYETNNNMAYIYDTGNQDVRTEGMSYGLMICLQMGDQEKFDKIWRWAKTYMQYPQGHQKAGLFGWQCHTDGSFITSNGQDPSCAPDGEMYFLTALWFASHRWGNDGAINYEEEAQYLAKAILNKSGRSNGQICPIFNFSNHIVTFGETSYSFTDPSYNLPGFLELWARWSDTNKDFWAQTPAAARGLLQNACHPTTGLFPDYSEFDGTPYRPDWAGYDTRQYKYDASRSAMNVGMDYNWFASDAQQPAMMERLLKFFKNDNFQHGYFNVDGSGADGNYNEAMRGSNGVACFALQNNDALAKSVLQKMWDTNLPTGQWRYYNGMVYYLSMLHASGYFKIYKPCPEVVEENLSGPAPIEFNGEQYSKDTTFKTLIDCKIYDVTITIEASTNTYTVSFVDYDDSEITSVEVAEGQAATAPDDPTREGYDFAGWDTDFSNVTSDLTVKATYTIKTFTVSFVDYDDSPIGTAQTVEYGQAATAPTEPTREHYTFKQWDTDFSNVKADLTVKAVYEENAKADYNALNAAIAQADALTEDDYTAATWSALQTALTAAKAVDADLYVEDQAIVDAATSALTSAIAALQEITFTVTFVDWDDTPIGDAQIIKKGDDAIAPNNPTRDGYTFIGWDTEFTNVTSDLTVKATYNKKDAGSKYEAENAQNNNTQTVTNTNASGGKYVRMNEGSLTFTVNVASAGMYTAKFAYSLTEDYKAQYLSVNGSQVGTVGFNKSGSSDPTFATVEAYVMLNEGSNTIALTKSWGYVAIDYLEISSYERTQFNIDEALVTPNPQPATVEVYEFLKDNFGKKTISGVMTLDLLNGSNTLPLASQSEVSYINSKSGKTPAIVGFDFMHSTGKNSTNDWQQSYTQAAIAMAEELWNAGGIPTFSWHWRDPNQNNDSFNTSETTFDLTKAFTNSSTWNTNSTEYQNIIKDIDIIAGYLEELQCAGVTILWRPIHEASGKWFWWGAKGAEPYKQLYKLMFDRLVNYHHLNNLIWVWNSDGTDADWYPGDAYVDVVGRDFYYGEGETYNHSSLVTDFESLAKLTNGKKLVTLAENGAVPYPENMDNDDAMWSWFMPWYGEYVTDSKHNTTSDWSTIMNDSRVITLNDMGGWDNRTKIYDTTMVGTLYAKNGFSVTPSVEGDSEQEITVTSSHNCDSVVVLYLHANAAAIVTYTVTFVDYDGTTLKTEEVESGNSATAPTAPTREHYRFKEWDTDFSNVTSDLTVTAVYTENGKADYTALNAAIELAESKKESDFTEDSWSALQTALTAAKAVDKNLYAESQSVVDAATEALTSAINALVEQTYTVRFLGKDGQPLKEQTVKKGESATAPEAPEIDGFTFSGWSGSFENVTADVTVTAQYTEHGKADYTALNNAIAQAEALTEGDYTAQSWSALQTALTAAKAVDKDLYAESQSIVDAATAALTSAISALLEQTFTVTFVGKDGNTLKEQIVKKGESATAPEAPEIEGFTFSGWSGSFENVTADVTITAQYTEKGKADYTALNAAITQAEALTEDNYTAATWSSLQTALTAAKAVDKDLYAESQSVVDAATAALTSAISALVEQTFTVTFVDKDGNTLKEQIVKKGESATAPEAPEIEGFTFSGWSGSFENVTADVTITAVYTENGKAVYVDLDNAINIAEALVQASYTDATWSTVASALASAKLVDRNLHIEDQNIVDAATEALTSAISALIVKTFTVTFVADGEEVDSQTIEYGKNATAPANPTKDGYDFVAWNGNYTNVTADVTITAEFKIKTFTIKFVDWNGTELSVQTIEYGSNAVPPTAPTREGYVFQEWVGTYQNVTADAIVVANYIELSKANYTALDQAIAVAKAKIQADYTSDSWNVLQSALASAEAVDRNLLAENQSEIDQATTALNAAIGALVLQTYTVKFVVDGEVVSTQEVTQNAAAVAPSTPVKLGYNFDHWDQDFSSVTKDMTITAIFTVKTFTVKFVDWNNSILSSQTVEYGASATAPTNPTREGYVFDGWNGSYENVVSNVTITAIYTEKGKASYTELDRTIASVANLREADYAVNTWIALQQALAQANAVDRNLFEEQQQIVNNANTTLENAINALDRLDRTTLATTIATANSLYSGAVEGQNKGQYPFGSKIMLQNAINEAKAVYETVSLTQIDLNIAVENLQEAIELFQSLVITADKSVLVMTIAKANSTMARANGNMGDGSGQYPIAAVSAFQSAINEAQQTYEMATIQEVVDNQVTILTNAIEAFLASANPITVDKSKLEEIIAVATNLLNTTSPGDKPGQYPYLEYMDLFSARISANEILAKDNPRQEDIDIQVVVLRNAIDAYINSKIPENVSVDDVAENQVVIYAKSHIVVVENADIHDVQIFDISGRCISKDGMNAVSENEIFVERTGFYIVKVANIAQRIMIR